MKIEKLPSGSYRIRQQSNGKRYSIVVDHKPTVKEATMLMSKKMESAPKTRQKGQERTMKDALDTFIDNGDRSGFSPSTVRAYRSIVRNLSDQFLSLNPYEITNEDIRAEIKLYGVDRSAKTVKNMYGLIRCLMTEIRPSYVLTQKLPSEEKKAQYKPTTDDVKRVLDAVSGTPFSVPYQLAVLGLRRGEICALNIADLSADNKLTINKALSLDEHGTYILKEPKTKASYRTIPIPEELADEIRRNGYIYRGNPNNLNNHLQLIQDKIGLPHFHLHMLRHYCAAYFHKLGYSDEQIMSWGGWATDSVMKSAYRYNLDPEEAKLDMSKAIGSIL